MNKPLINYRRIDQFKAIACDRGFTNEDAKQLGKLSKTATWEALLEAYGIPSEFIDRVSFTSNSAIPFANHPRKKENPPTGD
jgi:hypothetical protein